MSNLRICAVNLLESASTIAATTSAGTYLPANLLTEIKAQLWRSTSVAAEQVIAVNFATTQQANMIVFPFCNFSAAATLKVYLRTNGADVSPFYTSSATPVNNQNIKSNPEFDTYCYGGGAQGIVYFPQASFKRIDVGITDPTNPAGFVQASNLGIYNYWEPSVNCDYNAAVTLASKSVLYRNDSTDLLTDAGPRYREMNFDLSNMSQADRESFIDILRLNGIDKSFYISITPEDASAKQEILYSMLAKLSQAGKVTLASYARWVTSISVDEC